MVFVSLINVLIRIITRQIAKAINIKTRRITHAAIFQDKESTLSSTKKRSTIAAIIFIRRKGGSILFSHLFSNVRVITSELYLSDIFEIISILRGTKKAIITASNAATSDRKVGLGDILISMEKAFFKKQIM